MSEVIISIKGLDFFYDQGKPAEHHALKNVDLEIHRGEYVAFFGPSGCGKSTLLSSISGIERPTQGKVVVEGTDIAKADEDVLALYRQTEVGIVFQNFNLIPSLTVLNNTAMPMSFLGISRSEREKQALKVLDRLGIANLANRYPFELSGGQQQRVGIARALVNEQPITLADEPLGNLDSENANKVLAFLKELNEKDGKTIIMVTHESWSLRDAQKIFHMKDGQVIKVEDKLTGRTSGPHGSSLGPETKDAGERSKVMAPLFLHGYPEEQIARLSLFLTQLLNKEISLAQFTAALDKPYREGGVGLWKQRAEHISQLIAEVSEFEKEIAEARKKIKKDRLTSLKYLIAKLRPWIFAERKTPLSEEEKTLVDELIAGVLKGTTNMNDFVDGLAKPKSAGGAGISMGPALRAAERMAMASEDTFPAQSAVQNIK